MFRGMGSIILIHRAALTVFVMTMVFGSQPLAEEIKASTGRCNVDISTYFTYEYLIHKNPQDDLLNDAFEFMKEDNEINERHAIIDFRSRFADSQSRSLAEYILFDINYRAGRYELAEREISEILQESQSAPVIYAYALSERENGRKIRFFSAQSEIISSAYGLIFKNHNVVDVFFGALASSLDSGGEIGAKGNLYTSLKILAQIDTSEFNSINMLRSYLYDNIDITSSAGRKIAPPTVEPVYLDDCVVEFPF